MEDFLDSYGLYLYIDLGVIVLILIVIGIVNSIKNKNKVEDTSSILDIDIDGVVDSSFDYGFEKEDTVVMEPVEDIKKPKKNPVKKTSKKKKE